MGEKVSREPAAVRQCVERWRGKDGGRGSRIPEDLWNEAASAARVHGVHTTARTLRLNYYRLKARVSATEGEGRSSKSVASAFVEMRMEPVGGAGALIELVSRRGDQMRLHLNGARTTDLVGLAQAF
jgi:hypothetical protein